MKEIRIGIIGFGTVGTGVVKLLQRNADAIRRKLGASITIARIADLDTVTDRGVTLPPGVLTSNVNEVLNDPSIPVVVELIGGYEPARTFLLKGIAQGKHVVTANKALLALHGDELFPAAADKGVSLLFEAAVGGGIPILSAIRGNMAANCFSSVIGILNGTCNYILTKMTAEGADFGPTLKRAQELGFAEADPTFDIEGIDTAHKLALLVSLCFGTRIPFSSVSTEGISSISSIDIDFARQFGYRIKLLAIGKLTERGIEARVHPTMIPVTSPLADVDGVFNAIRLAGDFIGPVMMYGRGAGMDATASAVVGDIMEISRAILAGASPPPHPLSFREEFLTPHPVVPIGDIVSTFYLRFSAVDRPGVLAKIAGALGAHRISIESMIQTGRGHSEGDTVPIVIMTHEAQEENVRRALAEIDSFDIIREKTNLIRIEENLE
ncbi:MAG: homoserine dehydrogenase [Desulfuromonadia bacterium]